MTTTVKAAGREQFVALIPSMLGFTPAESIVLVPFAGTRTIGAMRFDLDKALEYPHEHASSIVGYAARVDGVTRVAAIVYTSTLTSVDVLPALASIEVRLEQAGLEIVDLLFVARNGWGSVEDAQKPRPLEQIDTSAVPAGFEPKAGDQLAGTELPEVSEDVIDIAERAVANIPAELLLEATLVAEPRTMEGWFERLLGTDLDDVQAMALAIYGTIIERPSLRDVLLIQTTRDEAAGAVAFEAQLAWEAGEEYPSTLAMVMWGEGDQPDPARLRRALELTRYAAAAVPSKRGPLLGFTAWLAWALGQSTHAEHYAQRALELTPEHGLSDIVLSFVGAGHLPAWAFSERGDG